MRTLGKRGQSLAGFALSARGVGSLAVALSRAMVVDPTIYSAMEWSTKPRRAARELALAATATRTLARLVDAPAAAGSEHIVRPTEGHPHLLGHLDHYGQLVASGELHECSRTQGLPRVVEASSSVDRTRSRIELWCTGEKLVVRKCLFGKHAKRRFIREVRALQRLAHDEVSVPRILELDPETLTITLPYLGRTVEQDLLDAGAELTGVELGKRAGRTLSGPEILKAYNAEGAQVFSETNPELRDHVLALLKSVHRGGVTVRGLSYSNIVISEAGDLSIIDFDAATVHRRPRSIACLIDRDRDIESFNAAFGGSAWTRRRLKAAIADGGDGLGQPYAPAYIGRGVAFGRLANPSSGFGKWHFVLRGVLRRGIRGASVLSVGTNNSAIELELLRNGANRAVCYELDPRFAEQARFLREAFEWADNTTYDLEVRNDSMERVSEEHTRFDLALALCSLYYLPADRMNVVASHLASLARSVVLQCNISQGIGRDDEDQYRRASVEFAKDLLAELGFASIRRILPARYSRPLVIGTSRSVNS
ncbi:MAG: hypothetical protein WA988_05290 [Candidatus Nanopelagicales bacterium]